jgi:hypothetical protein
MVAFNPLTEFPTLYYIDHHGVWSGKTLANNLHDEGLQRNERNFSCNPFSLIQECILDRMRKHLF